MEDSVVGFVIDTEGCTAVEAPKYIKCYPEEEKDAVESKLEEILFGKQPFHYSSAKFDAGLLESSSEKEEVGGKKDMVVWCPRTITMDSLTTKSNFLVLPESLISAAPAMWENRGEVPPSLPPSHEAECVHVDGCVRCVLLQTKYELF